LFSSHSKLKGIEQISTVSGRKAKPEKAVKISLLDLFAPEQILRYNSVVDAARTPDDLQTLVTGVR
jgi:hypothetical protein